MTDERSTLDTPQPAPQAGLPESAPPPPPEAPPAAAAPPQAKPAAPKADEAPAPPAEPEAPAKPSNKRWYVVKVQSGREEAIKEAIERRVKIEGLEEYFGQIIIPTEKVIELRNNKRVARERKLYPGYLMVEVDFNDRILYLFRETPGVGDFVGAGVNRPPPPMPPHEVERMLGQQGLEKAGLKPTKPKFDRGDRVRVKDGTFAGMEGEVKELLEAKNLVRVELTIFGRPVPVELEYWQVELV
ncbi:MAG TPA: transcription termination/antitermination protein NusG [Gemmataceae bacterium]|nr:transcription termination/antitermination protein NusG [Gemmataceae bacterium]